MNNNNSANNEELTIDLLALFRAIWHNIVFVLLAGVVCGVLTFFVTSTFITPKYQAAAMFYVNNSTFSVGSTSFSISSGELSAAQTLVDTYVTILDSRPTLEEIMKEAGVEYPLKDFREMISTENVKNTGIFKVTVTSESPLEAELIANTVTRVLPERIAEIVDGSSVRIVESAVVPAGRSSPNLLKNTAIGILLGMFLVVGIITMKMLFAPPPEELINSSDDLSAAYPDIPILAMIPDMRQHVKGEYSSYYKQDTKKQKGGK
ncbi:MAG: Wzz/FepE/Etk N-terminal domain-containing protein [Eubacteriales bacterium]|nr:Wzz/FepE/Etk N-terminal domain-containing protein [Eubacteriales bacterium]